MSRDTDNIGKKTQKEEINCKYKNKYKIGMSSKLIKSLQ